MTACPGGQFSRFYIRAGNSLTDKIFDLIFQMHPFYDRAPYDGNDKAKHDIGRCNLIPKNTNQQDETPQIYHRRRNEERKGNSQRKAGTGKSHKQRNG